MLCFFLGPKTLMTITTYHPQTNGQKKRNNWRFGPRLQRFALEYQCGWDLYSQPLTYAYNAQTPCATGLYVLTAVMPGEIPWAVTFSILTGSLTVVLGNSMLHNLKIKLLHHVATMKEMVSWRLAAAEQRYSQTMTEMFNDNRLSP